MKAVSSEQWAMGSGQKVEGSEPRNDKLPKGWAVTDFEQILLQMEGSCQSIGIERA